MMKFNALILFFMMAGFCADAQTVLTITSAPYNAVGDATNVYLFKCTSNSAVIETTNVMTSADVGKAIELFQEGVQTIGLNSYGVNATNNQDLVASILSIDGTGTNVTISIVCSNTMTNVFATYGHNNQTNFANAIAACVSGAGNIINIPAGKYLFLATYKSSIYGNAGVILNGGGITFAGAGTGATTLLGQAAWQTQSSAVWRGFLFDILTPVTNDYPLVFQNLAMDGGVLAGNTSIHGTIANTVDGLGWDQTHDAIVVRGGTTGNTVTSQLWTNVVFQHWRGEMVKSNDESTNGNLSIFGCQFNDGNATGLNYYASLNVSNCLFTNLFQVAEYYQAYYTNICYFQDNLITNITGNGFALNGGTGANPPFVIQGNTFYFPGNGYNGIETTPADNLFILSNYFTFAANGGNAIVLGCPGYQGTFDNSNIVVAANSFAYPSTIIENSAYGASDASGANRVEAVQVYNNTLTASSSSVAALATFGWTTNIHFYSNNFISSYSVTFSSGIYGAPFALVDANNNYWTLIYDLVGVNNLLTYSNGCKFQVEYPFYNGTTYSFSDSNPTQIPAGAQMIITNANLSGATIPVYLNTAMTFGPYNVPINTLLTAFWNNAINQWTTNALWNATIFSGVTMSGVTAY